MYIYNLGILLILTIVFFKSKLLIIISCDDTQVDHTGSYMILINW